LSGQSDHRVDDLVDRRHGRDLVGEPSGLEPDLRRVERTLDRDPERGAEGCSPRLAPDAVAPSDTSASILTTAAASDIAAARDA
jgi:hypothetical protein